MSDENPPASDPEIMQWDEVLRATHVCKKTVRRWIADGKFPPPLEGWPGAVQVFSRQQVRQWFIDVLRGMPGPTIDATATPKGQ
jgi:predicted DNA-binding transcriptional regulator AlpA